MKKLLIAGIISLAAVFADAAIVYDLAISGKSTKGKTSAVVKKSYTANFGALAKGSATYWYHDDAITQNAEIDTFGDVAGFEKVIAYVGEFKASRGYFSPIFDALDPADKLTVVEALSFNPATGKTDYNYKSAGKWCATVKFTVTTGAECYAVDANYSYKYYLVMEDCCGAGTWFICEKDFSNQQTVDVQLFNRYNSNVEEKANKVEILATCGSFPDVGSAVMAIRGSYDCKNARVSSASGQVVGIENTAECPTCCGAHQTANMFDCEGIKSAEDRPTLFNGTMSIKFNKSATTKYNDTL